MALADVLGKDVKLEEKLAAERKAKASPEKPNLLEDEDEPSAESVWVQFSTMKFVASSRKLKPYVIPVKHAIFPAGAEVCLLVKDPQRKFKDLVTEAGLSKVVTRVIGISKLKAKWKSFEQKRQLRDQYDLFLADERIYAMLPHTLGTTFYKKKKLPIPVDVHQATAEQLKETVAGVYNSTLFQAAPCNSFMVKCGHTTNTPAELAENLSSIIEYLSAKIMCKNENVLLSIHIKTSHSLALPLWQAENLAELLAKKQNENKIPATKRKNSDAEEQAESKPAATKKQKQQKTKEASAPAKKAEEKTVTKPASPKKEKTSAAPKPKASKPTKSAKKSTTTSTKAAATTKSPAAAAKKPSGKKVTVAVPSRKRKN
ncbi:U3 snoRNP-associated protein Cic1/Utp30 family protein [Schizosaccharomyces japonicus yFS275]|uniref:U3 snoRNP-associated protein Cic1/Utp30 family protein n=1 Tax=Schizosaccharomyces japonicus (strain yFS275 / FY16936) TaxID=402676 RepID=B6JXV7_SCHJY|nr:U3 snoRNP-associated protein Cic1/Utp30 family protein [Schizosaccharomyces japonicus yFS275]EEB06375.1 U3 snoRNP-associated protein Cic1/Utp30 family protein [Schizosaccharomyces japonicus yFS275]